MSDNVEKFLAHFGDDFFIQTFDDKKKGNHVALTQRRWSLQEVAKKQQALLNLNQRYNAGVYFCVNLLFEKLTRKSENIEAVRAFFLDLDGAPLKPVLEWALKPNLVVRTSSERWHCYWLLDDFYPDALKLFRDIQKWLAIKFKGDKSITDLCRVMRLPGFLNMKNEPFMVTWAPERAKPYSLQEIKDAFNNDKTITGDSSNKPVTRAVVIGMVDYISLEELVADKELGGKQNAADEFEFDEKRLRGALLAIPADDYDIWLRVGMALQGAARRDDAELSDEEAFEYWLSWSETSSKFDEPTIEQKWQGLNARGELGLGTIYELARQHDWNGRSSISWSVAEAVKLQEKVLKPVARVYIDLKSAAGIEAEKKRLGIK